MTHGSAGCRRRGDLYGQRHRHERGKEAAPAVARLVAQLAPQQVPARLRRLSRAQGHDDLERALVREQILGGALQPVRLGRRVDRPAGADAIGGPRVSCAGMKNSLAAGFAWTL
jgi:hypothetical protein